MKNPPKSEPGQYRGMMARVAWGEDYHRVLQNKLNQLENFIKERAPSSKCVSMVDTGVLSDRSVAERAGLGWIGKNTNLITKKYGSWVYLGELVTNIPFPPDSPMDEECGDCQKCLDFCPTGALVQGGQLNAKRCLAYLTQVKETLPEDVQIAMGNRIYGCDTCQQVCPKNKGKNVTHHKEFLPDGELIKPLLLSLLTMGKKEFLLKFGKSSAVWRGKKPIQRNAIIALAHFKDLTAVPALIDVMLKDPRPTLREAAAWSLGRIGGKEALKGLMEGTNKEKNEVVLKQIHKSINLLESVDK
jgi:epoxyqueuosine reductase